MREAGALVSSVIEELRTKPLLTKPLLTKPLPNLYEEQVQESIDALLKEGGRTTIVVAHRHIYMCVYIYIYIYMCVCVCVCVCVYIYTYTYTYTYWPQL